MDLSSLEWVDFLESKHLENYEWFLHKTQALGAPVKAVQGWEGWWSAHPSYPLKTWSELFILCFNISYWEDKDPKLENAFIKTLTNEHDKLVQMGILRSSKGQALLLWGQKIRREKESRRIKRLNLMLQSLKKRNNSKKSLSVQRNTRRKETKEKRKSSVPIAGRDSTLNMPAWRIILMRWLLSLRETISIFRRVFGREIIKIGIPSKKEDMFSWQAPRSPNISS